ncbi:MAG: ABC transporter permease [Chloroflexi bacterium]|nr:ABC transporter permease [Chloroflexota bacterium]
MADALRAELFKVLRRRMTHICLLAAMALVLTFYIILWLRIREGPQPRPDGYLEWIELREGMSFRNVVPYGFALERFFATLVSVVFAGTMMGNEYDWRTVGVVTSRGVTRWHFMFAKLASGVVFTFLTVMASFLVALAASAWFSYLYGLPFGTFDVARVLDMFASIGRTSFVILPFVVMSLLFATIWRAAGPAVGASLGLYFIEGIFTGLLSNARGFLSHIPDVLFNVNGDAVMRANGLVGRGDGGVPFLISASGPPQWRGALILAGWMVVILVAVFWRFQRRDIQE